MSIRARNIHFSNWTKVIEALANNGITVANEEEARTFLIETNSDANPFYYFVGYIKTTKEIYTHGQFYDCSEYDDSAILQKIEELESTLDTKVDLTVFEELQSDVKENELVTARALTELNDKKADADDLNSAVSSLNSSINTKANQSDLDALSAEVDLKANQTDLDALSAEVEENEYVTAAALTKLHEDKADKTDLENLSTEVYENEEITAAALSDIYEKLDNVAIPDMSNYVESTTYQTDIATLSSSDETLQKNIDDAVASSLLKTEQSLTDEEKAQVKDNLGFSSNLVFNNVSADTWVEDTTYADYGYRCDLVCIGVTASDYPEVIFDVEQANSGNYAPVCESDLDMVKIWSKVNDTIIVPTIQITR